MDVKVVCTQVFLRLSPPAPDPAGRLQGWRQQCTCWLFTVTWELKWNCLPAFNLTPTIARWEGAVRWARSSPHPLNTYSYPSLPYFTQLLMQLATVGKNTLESHLGTGESSSSFFSFSFKSKDVGFQRQWKPQQDWGKSAISMIAVCWGRLYELYSCA